MLDLRRGYQAMCAMRYFEEEVYRLFQRNLLRGSMHLANGQEAVAAGFAAALSPQDYVLATYRGHAHVLGRGVPQAQVFAELMGKETGLNRGRGGSMHLTSVEHRMMGCYAIVGAHLPVANGLALAAKLRGEPSVVVCFFGDGTTNIGAFHEALNLAAVWQLPVVFVCENNLYMEYTPISEMIRVEHPAADRASAYGLERHIIDGNDLAVVAAAAQDLVESARSGRGPVLAEMLTYRSGGHSRADPGTTYRPAEEIAAWRDRDPLKITREQLLAQGETAAALDELEAGERAAVNRAVEAALTQPDADPDGLLAYLWADGSATWRH